MIGSKLYRITAATAGTVPIPKSGMAKPRSAMLGIACITLAVLRIGL